MGEQQSASATECSTSCASSPGACFHAKAQGSCASRPEEKHKSRLALQDRAGRQQSRRTGALGSGREHASDPAAAGAPVRRRALVRPERLRLSEAEATSAPTSACSPASRATPASARRRGLTDPSLVGSSRLSPRQTVPLSSGSKCGAREVRDERDRSISICRSAARTLLLANCLPRPCKRSSSAATAPWSMRASRRLAPAA